MMNVMSPLMTADNFRNTMNKYGSDGTPFLFLLDFQLRHPIVVPIDEISGKKILFDFEGFTNHHTLTKVQKKLEFGKFPISFREYDLAFQAVQHHIRRGNTYLLNLTFPTSVQCNYDLGEIYCASVARYRLLLQNHFVVFSPEPFVRIEGGIISSCPMKGTIDAALPDAGSRILQDKKETAEHATIVDLIRNDLNMVAKRVTVESYRYVEKIRTHEKDLLQVSSKITGVLESSYRNRLGDILFTLCPAGSISGAPKKKTVEIIHEVENYDRDFYTGVMGYYDGEILNSAVMIRFLENIEGTMIYKSGGGITAFSDSRSEYQEMIDKVYVPIA
jgi:para-aminobenzoate synthetase component 1